MQPTAQRELFPMSQVKQPRNCTECVQHFEDPYHRCREKPGVLINPSLICEKFVFADEQSSVLLHNNQSNQKCNDNLKGRL